MNRTKALAVSAKMQEIASKTKDDRLFNTLTRLSDRLLHQGALFEKPLTKYERSVIQIFASKV